MTTTSPYKILPRPLPWIDGYTHDVWLFGVRMGAFPSKAEALAYVERESKPEAVSDVHPQV